MSQPTSISEWLTTVGMPEYATRFAENDIDVSVLGHLTDRDLKEMGVSLGHRRKLLATIAELPVAAGAGPMAPRDDAQRRHLSIMFCDLVGSTAAADDALKPTPMITLTNDEVGWISVVPILPGR